MRYSFSLVCLQESILHHYTNIRDTWEEWMWRISVMYIHNIVSYCKDVSDSFYSTLRHFFSSLWLFCLWWSGKQKPSGEYSSRVSSQVSSRLTAETLLLTNATFPISDLVANLWNITSPIRLSFFSSLGPKCQRLPKQSFLPFSYLLYPNFHTKADCCVCLPNDITWRLALNLKKFPPSGRDFRITISINLYVQCISHLIPPTM